MGYYTTKRGEEVVELLQLALSHYETEKKDLLLKVDDNISPYLPLKEQPNESKWTIGTSNLGYSPSYWFKSKSFWSGEEDIKTSTGLAARKEEINKAVDNYIEACTLVYNENLPIIEHNKKVVEKIKALMKVTGIPDTYSKSYFKTSRSRTKTTETTRAGYLQDIDRLIKTSQPAIPSKDSLLSGMETYYNKRLAEARQEETKAEREQQEKEELHKIALLRAKYTPEDASSDAWEIREAILSKDKYLRLAYYLEKNRGDWNDGYDYAATGLNGFVVEDGNSLDQDIYDCINECIESGNNGDIDGRIFRDCEYNYSRLYGFVTSQALLDDLDKLKAWNNED